MTIRIAVLTVSDGCAAGKRKDTSGDQIVSWAADRGFVIAARSVIADETDLIASYLVQWCDGGDADLILTTGGTGLGPRDVTPEATRAVVEREVPGICEAMRFSAFAKVPRSMLSRGIAGTRGNALIVNLPGSPGGVRDGLAVLQDVLPHAIQILTDQPTDH